MRCGGDSWLRQVLGRMKQLMVDNNTAASHSFLLDDDSSIPFSLDDIQNLMDEKVPPLLLCLATPLLEQVLCPMSRSSYS
jgi:myosin-5